MAATGTPTPNIGLRIPLGTDPASVDDINYNSNLIDTKLGAVGNDSVQDQIDDLNSNFSRLIQGAIEVSDANNATEQGIPYWLGSGALNVPEDWVYVRVVNRDNNGTYISQIGYPMNYNLGDKIWFRQKNGSGWGYWRRITTEVQTKKTFYRVVKSYNNLTIGSSGWLKLDDFSTIKNEHSSILTDSWFLASMTIRGWTGGTMPINIGKGSNGSDFYLMGVAQTGLSITVEYFFANPDVVTDPT